MGDACNNCPNVTNADQLDSDLMLFQSYTPIFCRITVNLSATGTKTILMPMVWEMRAIFVQALSTLTRLIVMEMGQEMSVTLMTMMMVCI